MKSDDILILIAVFVLIILLLLLKSKQKYEPMPYSTRVETRHRRNWVDRYVGG